jgi:hypothetical protein
MPAGVLVLDTRHWFLIPTARKSLLTSSSRSTYRLTGHVWTPSRDLATSASSLPFARPPETSRRPSTSWCRPGLRTDRRLTLVTRSLPGAFVCALSLRAYPTKAVGKKARSTSTMDTPLDLPRIPQGRPDWRPRSILNFLVSCDLVPGKEGPTTHSNEASLDVNLRLIWPQWQAVAHRACRSAPPISRSTSPAGGTPWVRQSSKQSCHHTMARL